EAIADNADVGPIADDLTQTAEELGAIARQLLHLGGQRQVKPASQLDDLALLVLDLGFGNIESGGDLGELLAQRGKLRAELLDLGARRPAGLLLGGKRRLGRLGALAERAQPDVAAVDLLLRENSLFLRGGEPRLQLL